MKHERFKKKKKREQTLKYRRMNKLYNLRSDEMLIKNALCCLQLKTTFSTDSRVQNMFDILLDDGMDKEKKEKVSNSFSPSTPSGFFL